MDATPGTGYWVMLKANTGVPKKGHANTVAYGYPLMSASETACTGKMKEPTDSVKVYGVKGTQPHGTRRLRSVVTHCHEGATFSLNVAGVESASGIGVSDSRAVDAQDAPLLTTDAVCRPKMIAAMISDLVCSFGVEYHVHDYYYLNTEDMEKPV